MTRALVVINPLSGHGRGEGQLRAHATLAREVLAACDVDATVRPTTAAGDARAFAREAVEAGVELVVAWGGDGTVNEVASALVQTPATLAVVPAGSGNGLAWDAGIPFEPRAALQVAARGRTMRIDAGRVDESWFFNIAGIGLDALIAARFAERGLRRRGPLAYFQLTGSELLRYRAKPYTLSFDDEEFDRTALLVALANGRQYGNRMRIAPGARLDDGLLEVVIVEALSLPAIAWRLPALFRGTLRAGGGITMRAAPRVRVRAASPIPFHVDGEPRIGTDELVVTTVPGALRLRVPAA